MKTKIKIILISFLLLGMFNCTKPVDETLYCWTCNWHQLVNGENSSGTSELCDKTENQIKQIEDDGTGLKQFGTGYIVSEIKCNLQ